MQDLSFHWPPLLSPTCWQSRTINSQNELELQQPHARAQHTLPALPPSPVQQRGLQAALLTVSSTPTLCVRFITWRRGMDRRLQRAAAPPALQAAAAHSKHPRPWHNSLQRLPSMEMHWRPRKVPWRIFLTHPNGQPIWSPKVPT